MGEGAFSSCQSLETITIPKNVTFIGTSVFDNCDSLKEIDVVADNKNYASKDGILYNKDFTTLLACPAGKSGVVSIPNTVTSIAEFAFFYCDKIAAVVLPASLTTISNNAFYFCTSLRSLIVPESVTTIGAHAFAFCNLLNIYFEASEIQDGFDNDWNFSNCSYYFDAVKSTNDDGFEIVSYSTDEGTSAIVTGYSGSASTLTIPSSASNNQIKGIADYAFYNNETIKNVTIPKSVSYLGIGAFSGASNLETVSLEANIETINPYVFLNCTSLTSVSLAETITSIWIASFALPIAISLLILI